MKFFSHFYLENHMYFHDYLKYILIFAALVILLLAVSQYLRHRMDTKYRDIKNQYYEVHFNQDFSAYTLTPINLVNNNIELIDKE